jgi:hypothetical protein
VTVARRWQRLESDGRSVHVAVNAVGSLADTDLTLDP